MPDPMPQRQASTPKNLRRRVLFISNGHGEDLSGAAVAKALQQLAPDVELSALPIVGAGNSYRREGIFCHCVGATMPSGGFVYMSAFQFWRDIQAGLVGQTWQQIQAARQFGKTVTTQTHDLVFATGDVVALAMALATGRAYFSYLVPFSAYYENRLQLPFPTVQLLRRRRCLQVFGRDQFTVRLLHQQRVNQAQFVGNAFMDVLPQGQASSSLGLKSLNLTADPVVALLPGSRLPECGENFRLILDFCALYHDESAAINSNISSGSAVAWYAAITPSLLAQLPELLANTPWQWQLLGQDISQGIYLERNSEGNNDGNGAQKLRVYCVADGFSEILQACTAVVGMAGTALEQAVGLGKPVITFVGGGPQFNYRFAEAQQRLLGRSIHLIAPTHQKANRDTLRVAIPVLADCLYNSALQQECIANGKERIGGMGGAAAMAQAVLDQFEIMAKDCY
jgi:uncharacterized protein (TIGR03492 family)